MYSDIRHRGAWLPAWALHDEKANERLAQWITEHVANLNNRVFVTPVLGSPIENPPLLRALASRAPHLSAKSNSDWLWGSGPVVLAWPNDSLLEQAVPMADSQTLILFERPGGVDFTGWATASEAYNAVTGEILAPLPEDLHYKIVHVLNYDSELVGGARRGAGREQPQRYLRELAEAGLDEDFIVTYALALNQQIAPKHIREHFQVATAGRLS